MHINYIRRNREILLDYVHEKRSSLLNWNDIAISMLEDFRLSYVDSSGAVEENNSLALHKKREEQEILMRERFTIH